MQAQDCFTLFGATGQPPLGLDYKLCATSPGFVNLNATVSIGTATYVWSTTSTFPAIQASTGGVYTVSITSGGVPNACILNFNVTSYPNPVVNLGNDTAICSGSPLTLYANPGLPDYIWSDGVTTVDSLVVTAADTYSVTVSDTNQCAGIDSIIVTENPLPIVNLGGAITACPGDTVTVDAGVFASYIWSDGSTNQVLTTNLPATYTVTVTDINGCEASDLINFTNDTLPVVNIGLDDSLCDGGIKVLNAGAGPYTSYLWSDGTGFQTATYTVTSDPWVVVEDTNGCFGSDTMHLEIFPTPNVNLGTNLSFCINDTLVLNAGGGYTSYSWNNGTALQTLNVTSAGTYSITVEDVNGCFGYDTTVVAQDALPIVNIGSDIEYCNGTTFSQLINAGNGFVLYNWMDGVFTQIRNIDQTYDTVWVEVLDTNGCKNTDTMYVIENPLPVLNLGPNDTICSSQVKSLNAGNPNGAITNYIWSNGSTNQTINIGPNPGQINDSLANYSVTITDNNGCQNMDTMSLYTYALPRPDLGNDTAFCNGDPFSMILDPGAFTTYNWSTGVNTPTISIVAVGAVYSVTVSDLNGCINSDMITIIDNPLPTPNLGPDEAFCQGNSFTKILNPGSFSTYLWSDGSVGQVLGVSVGGIYSVTVSDINNCMNDDDIVITENPSPAVDLGPDVYYCEDVAVSHLLDATTNLPGPGFNFLWTTGATTGTIIANSFGTFGVVVTDQITNCSTVGTTHIIATLKANPDLGEDGVICEGQLINLDPKNSIPGYIYTWNTGATTATINVFETGTYWVQLDASNGTCTGLIDTIVLDPGVLPVVQLGEDLYPCIGQQVNLLNNASDFPGTTYEWQDGTKGGSYEVTKTGTYEVEATNQCGSVVDQVFIEFQDCSNVYVPTAFTPNGDGKNDTFYPKSDQEFTEYGFWVYDRWGRLLFKTNTPNFGWNGTFDGDPVANGVYIWRISYVSTFQDVGNRIEKVGEVTLIK